jgi:hypothetical protein
LGVAAPALDLTRHDGYLVSGALTGSAPTARTSLVAPIEKVATWPLLLAESVDRIDMLPAWPTDWRLPLSLRQIARLLADGPTTDLSAVLAGVDPAELREMDEHLRSPIARRFHANGLLAQHPTTALGVLHQIGCLDHTAPARSGHEREIVIPGHPEVELRPVGANIREF